MPGWAGFQSETSYPEDVPPGSLLLSQQPDNGNRNGDGAEAAAAASAATPAQLICKTSPSIAQAVQPLG